MDLGWFDKLEVVAAEFAPRHFGTSLGQAKKGKRRRLSIFTIYILHIYTPYSPVVYLECDERCRGDNQRQING